MTFVMDKLIKERIVQQCSRAKLTKRLDKFALVLWSWHAHASAAVPNHDQGHCET